MHGLDRYVNEKHFETIHLHYNGNAVNQYVYLNEYIKARLVHFIEKYFLRAFCVFWSDLAFSYNAETLLNFLIENSENNLTNLQNADIWKTFGLFLKERSIQTIK